MGKFLTEQIRLNNVRLSYCFLVNGRTEEKDGKTTTKFSTQCLIPYTNTSAVTRLTEAIEKVKRENRDFFKNKAGNIPHALKVPKRDGNEDDAYAGIETYKDMWVCNTTSNRRPGIVDRDRQLIDIERLDSEIYSGMWADVLVTISPFEAEGNKGIAAFINAVRKKRDDDRIDGTIDATKAFDESDDEDDDGADNI